MNRTLLSILAGLGGMVGWGSSDFFANSASEKVGHFKTFFWSQLAAIVLILIMVFAVAPQWSFTPLLFGLTLFGAVMYTIGYLLFYKGFEIGNVSVVSAVINTQTLFVILISFLRGQRLSPFQIVGICLLLFGVLLVSVNFKDLQKGTMSLVIGVKETLISAICFGVFYWPINEYVVEKIHWLPVVLMTKIIAVSLVFLISQFQKKSLHITHVKSKFVYLLIAIGVLEAVGVLSATFGQSYGDGIIVAPISSALTIVTVALAMIFLKEQITKIQAAGIAIVVGGIILSAL